MKVRNFLSTYTTKHNMLFSTIYCKDKEKDKYSEAYVFLLIKGIKNKHPITGLDFALLYLILIMTYNFSLEKLILSCEEADNIYEKENKLYEIKFLFNGHILNA